MEISTALGHIAHRCCPLALTLTQCRRRRVCVSRGFADRAISRDLAVFEATARSNVFAEAINTEHIQSYSAIKKTERGPLATVS